MKGGSGRVKDSRTSWLFLAVNGCVMGLIAGPVDSFGILVVVFVEYFDESNTKIGWVGSLSYALVCGSYPLSVSLCRGFGFRKIAIVSAILFSTGFLITPSVSSANYLFFTYCIPVGVGFGFVDCLTITILCEYFQKSLGLATGIRLACVATGSMMFNYLYPILIEIMGWKKTFYCVSSLGTTLIVLAFSYRKSSVLADHKVVVANDADLELANDAELKSANDAAELKSANDADLKSASDLNQPRQTSTVQGFWRDRGFQLIVLGCVPFLFVIGVPLMFMAQYAKSLGYPLSQAKWLIVVRSMFSLFGRGIMGFVGDFASRHGIINHIASAVTAVFSLASGLCSLTQHLPLMILYMSVVGLLEGIYWVAVPLMMNDLTGGKNADYAYSLMTLLTALGFLTGPSSMGFVYDVTGDFRKVLYVICACSLVACVVIALGIYVRSQSRDENEPQATKDNNCLRRLFRAKYSNISGCREQEIMPKLPKSEKQETAQYETAV